eukprot:CAMPEP_0170523486 /NCGR_PEP_ID=MMETSP0209-20121228/8884_1 /TAXON_ID=665100 ORGANISM="Litonotus pictus, Strain P1" /NCGR_SAMPLE_ID=MMETSP0209 /ASSEMBLY_ACC=CAM_ASM_000301 /LENGTH=773 /DNA_ID=CAMNT_0010811573 /DNA_START=15 /DNA_END=2336 /DNA_ORIENTATION=-
MIDAKEKREDHSHLKDPKVQLVKHKSILIKANNVIKEDKDEKEKLEKSFEEKSEKIEDQEVISKLKEELEWGFDNISPLIYLNLEQRKKMLEVIYFVNFFGKETLYNFGDNEDLDSYILFEGEYQIYNKKMKLIDIVCGRLNFFGYGGPIFKKRNHSIVIDQDSIVGVIPKDDFLEILCPFSKFSKHISRNILNKEKIFTRLDDYKNFVLNSIDRGKIDIDNLLSLYKKMNSCLHTKSDSSELDFDAWSYSFHRLPENILSTFAFVLTNKPPNLLSIDEKVSEELIPKVNIELRNRDVFKYLDGKSVVIVREMETDVLDFMANMCIHMIESKKLRQALASPLVISMLHQNRESSIEKVYKELSSLVPLNFPLDQLKKIAAGLSPRPAEKLLSILLHNEDYSMKISKGYVNENDPIENFIQNLWVNAKELLGITSNVEIVDDLVVDIMQGSKRTLINCVSPHIYMNKEKIISWAEKEIEEGRLKMKTPVYQNCKASDQTNNDLLMAYSYYYYETFPQEKEAKKKLEEEHGIRYITNTFSTGVAVILINPNKFDQTNMDQSVNFKKPVSKNHLIIHIGYTFGAQSKEIIKPILLLFGSHTRSLNIMGKAGGLVGRRTDILISSKCFYDKNNDVSILNIQKTKVDELRELLNQKVVKRDHSEKSSELDIHIGPMLTVSGTIIQNDELLNFYKCVMGCIGIEMEGYFYAKEIESATKHLLLNNKDIDTRLFYYVSDLPLDPNQNLANEGGIVNWDEGVKTMNAIQRYILRQVLNSES